MEARGARWTVPSRAQAVAPAQEHLSHRVGEGGDRADGFFLAVPDDVHRPSYGGRELGIIDTDVLDELQVFVAHRPAWVGPDGFPLSWMHYQHGLRSIAREALRSQLAHAQAVRMAGVVKADWEEYQRDIARMTEVPKHG